ncbi:beta-lactamase family protein [Ammoniphilus sp. YIM 78166]|uniref:serine hydrolase domain-containing protein n=1 Tax=Ammoniphilus sp. YIM 78166 TaxID=1644106 RepID=UPI001F0E9DDC|nr:beta-lactamase family protein [Ammoniphilus sp. YIM 78166]
MKVRGWFLSCLVVGVLCGQGFASADELDDLLNQAIQENQIPGAVVLVQHKGKIVKHQAYGYALDYEGKRQEMKEDTIFDVASITKVFTATVLMKLYEEGKVRLDDPVSKHLPEFAHKGVTLRHLLTHTSGFPAWIPLYEKGSGREDRLAFVLQHPLQHPPGEVYTYSDLNMITIGCVIEKVSGKKLDEYMDEVLIRPLGLRDTFFNPPLTQQGRIAATEYQPEKGRGLVWGTVQDENAWSLDGVAGHAGLFSTAKELAVFAQMMLDGGAKGGTRLLKPDTVKLLTENQAPENVTQKHGLGWELGEEWYMDVLAYPSTFGHTGFSGTSLVVSPKEELVVILLTNRVHPTRETESINPLRQQVARLALASIREE